MKTFKYHIDFKDGTSTIEEFQVNSVLDGHYEIWRKYRGVYTKAHWVKN